MRRGQLAGAEESLSLRCLQSDVCGLVLGGLVVGAGVCGFWFVFEGDEEEKKSKVGARKRLGAA